MACLQMEKFCICIPLCQVRDARPLPADCSLKGGQSKQTEFSFTPERELTWGKNPCILCTIETEYNFLGYGKLQTY